MTNLIRALAASLVLAGCAAANPSQESRMDASVTLQPQHSTTIAPDASLRFERVDDSRCPPDVRCVWAGKITYHFSLTGPSGVHRFTLTPAAPAHSPPQLPGVTIALGPAEPPPVRPANAASAQADAAAPVTLLITRS